jgi:hypothetical protein
MAYIDSTGKRIDKEYVARFVSTLAKVINKIRTDKNDYFKFIAAQAKT